MASVTRGAASLFSSRMVVACIALLFLGVSTRLLTLEEMAVFALYNTLCGMLTVLCSLGLLATCVQRLPGLVAEGRAGEAGRLVRTAVIVYLLGAAAVISVVCLFAETISRLVLKTPATAPQVRVAAIAALCFGLYEASQLLLSSMQRFGRLGTYNIAAAIAQRTLSLALFLRFGMEGFLLGFAAGSLIGAAMGSTVFGRMLGREARGGQGGAGEGPVAWIRYSMPFYLDGFLRYLYMHADQVLVAVFLDPVDLSIYFLAKRFIQYCEVLVSSLVTPLGTRVSELRSGDPAGVARLYGLSLRLFVLLFIPLAVLLACLSPFLILVVGGQRYAAGALPLGLLFLSLPFFSIFSHLATFVWVLGVPLDRVRNNMVSMAAQAAAIVVLMPWLRLPGLALARSAGFAAAMVVAGRMARHRLPVAPPGGLQAGRCLLPTAAMASIILIPHLLIGDARLLPLYALPAVTACLAGYMMVVLTARDRNEIASRIPGRGRMARAARGLLSPGAAGGATPI